MLSEKIEKALERAFGFSRAGSQHALNGESCYVDSLWVIELSNHYWRKVIVVGVDNLSWPQHDGDELPQPVHHYRGLLLAGPVHEPRDREFGGADPYRVIPIQWPEKLIYHLENINTLPYGSGLTLGGGNHTYEIHTYTIISEMHFRFHGLPVGKKMKDFYDVLINMIETMAHIYDDKEINDLINAGEAWINRI